MSNNDTTQQDEVLLSDLLDHMNELAADLVSIGKKADKFFEERLDDDETIDADDAIYLGLGSWAANLRTANQILAQVRGNVQRRLAADEKETDNG